MENFTVPEVTADDHVLGPSAAPVTVLEYGDYECPFCRGAYRDVHRMLDLYPGSILFVFRNFPITQLHPHAEQAAEAAEAAAAQGKFWEMHDLLLANQENLKIMHLLRYAEGLELDQERLHDEIVNHVYAEKVSRDVESADMSGVSGTPTFFINGQRHDGAFERDDLIEAIDARLTEG